MPVKVKFFARMREEFGRAEDQMEHAPGLKVSDVWRGLSGDKPMPEALLVAVGVGLVGLAGWLASRRALVAYLSVLAALLLDDYVHASVGYLAANLVVPLLAGVNVCLAWLALGRRPAAAGIQGLEGCCKWKEVMASLLIIFHGFGTAAKCSCLHQLLYSDTQL